MTRSEKIKTVKNAGYTVRMLPPTLSGKKGTYVIEDTRDQDGFFLYSQSGSDKELDIVLSIINSKKVAA